MKNIEETILELIPSGKSNAVHMNDICKKCNVSGYLVKKCIQNLRKQGRAIISDTDGYWLAENNQEIADFIIRMSKQATSRFSSVKTLKNQCKECEGQISINDLEESEGVDDGEN